MKFPRFSQNSAPSGDPAPVPPPDVSSTAGSPPDIPLDPNFTEHSVQPLPFNGVPPPPPPAAPEEIPPLPASEQSAKKGLFQRFRKATQKTPSAPPNLPNSIETSDAYGLSQEPPPGPSNEPPPPPPPAINPRDAEREEARRQLRNLEIRTGVSMGVDEEYGTEKDSSNRDVRHDDSDTNLDYTTARNEGKPLGDAAVESSGHLPSMSDPSSNIARANPPPFDPTMTGHQHPTHLGPPHFIDTSHIDNPYVTPPTHSQIPQQSSVPQPHSSGFQTGMGHQQNNAPRPQQNDSQMAELFASQAFGASAKAPYFPPPPQSSNPDYHPSFGANTLGEVDHTHRPVHLGWGSVAGTGPSGPIFGPPQHLSQPVHPPGEVDAVLNEKIKHGREFAMRAVQHEEEGRLDQAEQDYIQAISILLPCSKELDIGSDLTKHVRQSQKAKIQREAAAMLDRCEEIRKVSKARGPEIPREIPKFPEFKSKGKPVRPPSSESNQPSTDSKKSSKGSKFSLPPPPPPPPPQMSQTDDDDLLLHHANRQNVSRGGTARSLAPSSSASHDFPNATPENQSKHPEESAPDSEIPVLRTSHKSPNTATSNAVSENPRYQNLSDSLEEKFDLADLDQMADFKLSPRGDGKRNIDDGGLCAETCFLCRRPADLRSRCNHTFCSNCGNQVVTVFSGCPVPNCQAHISIEDFSHILS